MGELPDFEVMIWQLCYLQRSAMNCVQITLLEYKETKSVCKHQKNGKVFFWCFITSFL